MFSEVFDYPHFMSESLILRSQVFNRYVCKMKYTVFLKSKGKRTLSFPFSSLSHCLREGNGVTTSKIQV